MKNRKKKLGGRVWRVGILYTLEDFRQISYNPGDDIVRDGQRYLLGQVLSDKPIEWEVFYRWLPGTWASRTPTFFNQIHAKMIWPYWYVMPIRRENRMNTCDLLINASGPLLYAGRRYHSLFEPWAIVLTRFLRHSRRPKLVNLAFGTNFALDSAFLDSRLMRASIDRFCRKLFSHALVNTCRDSLAHRFLEELGIRSFLLPCPSLLARRYYELSAPDKGYVAINFRPAGTNMRSKNIEFDPIWVGQFVKFIDSLRNGNIRFKFVFHERQEVDLAKKYLPMPLGDYILPKSIPEFLLAYGSAIAAFSCRIHGIYAAASFGVPGVAVGDDTRLGMVNLLGLPTIRSCDANHEEMFGKMMDVINNRQSHKKRLLALCERTNNDYLALLETALASLKGE